jgi:HlyD family secretion protein
MTNAFKKHKYIYLALILVLIVGGYYWYKKSQSGNTTVQYKNATAERGTLVTSVSASGNIIVDQSATVDPTINGTVANLSVNVGDKVKKGQSLFNIENDDLGVTMTRSYSSYLQSQASLESAKASKKEAKNNYENANSSDKSLFKKKLDAAEISVTVAEENIKAALADYQNKKSDAVERNVKSPIDGTVNAINVKNGDNLGASSSTHVAPIIIGDLNTLRAQVQVNEVDISNVSIGQKTMLTFDAIQNFTTSGKVEKMDSLGTTTQGVVTYNVTISMDSLDPRIKPDMSVTAAIITELKQNVITVPVSAVKTQEGNSYVEVLSGSVPIQTTVEVGASNDTSTEIISGINPGDKVVTQTINPNATSTSTTNSGARVPGLGGFH